MANSVAIPRSLVIYGVCLPLAIMLGYNLAEPLESSSLAVVVLVLSVLSIPVFVRWHHVLLIAAWNSWCVLYFLPGEPVLWAVMACVSFLMLIVTRSMGRELGFFNARWVAWSLLAMVGVATATMVLTGGIGVRALNSDTYGGKHYIYLFAAVAGYFGLAAQRVEKRWARPQSALFFLSGLAAFLGIIGAFVPGVDFLSKVFPTPYHITGEQPGDVIGPSDGMMRVGVGLPFALALFSYVLARFGLSGVLDIRRPWRLLIMLGAMVLGATAGFRSILALFILTLGVLFVLEDLVHTRYALFTAALAIVAGCVVAVFARDLPLAMQRTVSFLPVDVDYSVRQNAEGSTNWRLEIWKEALPQIPKYLLRGKGYAIDPQELAMANMAVAGTGESPFLLSGDYHSGPLSIIIPFGLAGVGVFIWFVWASLSALHQNWRYGAPELRMINTFLYAAFIVRTIYFLFIFGSLYSDLFFFTGLIGMSVSLNGGVCSPPLPSEPEPEEV
jgi:hypothetical protein